MKRVSLAMAGLLLLLCAGTALSQGRKGGDPAQMVDRQVTAMKDRLKLTDDQEKKVKTILQDQMKKQAELRQKYNMQPGERPPQEAMEAMKKLREDVNTKMSEVLSKEQMADYQKMMEERRQQFGGRKKQQ